MRKIAYVIACVGLLGGLAGGCGDDEPDLPADAAAKVRDHVIATAAVERATVGQLAIRHSASTMPPYLPTDIDGCIAAKREQASREELQERCERERDRHEQAALQLLIRGQWYRLEAQRRGIKVPTDLQASRAAAAHAGVDTAALRGVTEAYLLQLRFESQSASKGATRSPKQAIASYNDRLRSEYQDDTVCADGYDIPECG